MLYHEGHTATARTDASNYLGVKQLIPCGGSFLELLRFFTKICKTSYNCEFLHILGNSGQFMVNLFRILCYSEMIFPLDKTAREPW